MSDILCKWLNEDVKLSRNVCPLNLEESFANGFLIGELLSHYGLQENFTEFSKSSSSESIINNFSKVYPTFLLLQIKFDSNLAKEIINESPGIVTQLLYQLYIKLAKKCNSNKITDTMVAMRAHGLLKIDSSKTKMFKEHLKNLLPRQIDKDLRQLTDTYREKIKLKEEEILALRFEDDQKQKSYKQNIRLESLCRSRLMRAKQDQIMLKVREVTNKTRHLYSPILQQQLEMGEKINPKFLKQHQIENESKNMFESIQKFESDKISDQPDQLKLIDKDIELFLNSFSEKRLKDFIKPEEGMKYLLDIRQRVNENTKARKEREKRRRNILIEQLKEHQHQQEIARDEALFKRLTKETEMEKKITVQLANIRKEKDIMKNNRLELEKQFTERRLKEFQDFLDQEAEFCRLDKIKYAEDVRKQKEIHDEVAKKRALEKYEKHWKICKEILLDIIDFTCKVAEYRQITEKLVPPKVIRDWKTLFCHSKSLYEAKDEEKHNPGLNVKLSETVKEDENLALLDEKDFEEYKNCTGEWELPVDTLLKPADNQILGFILKRINLILFPPILPPALPEFPEFPIKVCLLGKSLSGKSCAAKYFAASHRVVVLDIENIVNEFLQLWVKNKANLESKNYEASFGIPYSGSIDNNVEIEVHEEQQLTTEAKLGKQIDEYLQRGQSLSEELIVEVLLCKIRELPENTGWILDGFPVTIQQAQLLEKGLSGYVIPSEKVEGSKEGRPKKSKLTSDPIPPPQPKAPISGFDIVILLDVSDEIILKRAQGRVINQVTGEEFHIEFKPPSGSLSSSIKEVPKLIPVVDLSNKNEQVLARLTGFQANWNKLEKWFSQFNNIYTIDASGEQAAVESNVEKLIEETLKKIQDLKNNTENKENEAVSEKIVSPNACDLTSSSVDSSSNQQVFVDQPIEKEIAEILLNIWSFIEETYIKSIKHIFRKIRSQCVIIDRYFYDRRDSFKHFLKKPDVKQIFVTQWQQEYNLFSEDMRSDDECKAELHQRVDDLCERLWEISDGRKEEAEKELSDIMEEGWLPDNIGFLTNHYISLMQSEVNRYQHTCYILREYYNAMEKDKSKVKPCGFKDFTRLPLLEIPDCLKQPGMPDVETENKLSTNSFEMKKSQVKTIIPLIPQQGRTIPLGSTFKENEDSEEVFEIKILLETAHKALNTIELQKNFDSSLEEIDKKKIPSAPKEKNESAEKKKSKKKQQPAPEEVVVPIQSEEEVKENQLRQVRKEEYQKAIAIEGQNFKARVELICSHGALAFKKIKEKAAACYKDMDTWLGKRFLQEMESINKMCELLRSAIECEKLLTNAIVLEGEDFYVEENIQVFEVPIQPRCCESPSSKEVVPPSIFTCIQLTELSKQFKDLSADGLISSQLFADLLSSISSSNIGEDKVAEKWKNLSPSSIDNIMDAISADKEYVNWKSFMLSISEPYPLPTAADLKNALDNFREFDQTQLGIVGRSDYDKVVLWFDKCQSNSEISQFRLNSLKELFFEIFSNRSSTGDMLDYTDMLLHFAASTDPFYGLSLALCIVSCQIPPKESFFTSQDNEDDIQVSIDNLLKVFHFGEPRLGCGHRFDPTIDKLKESETTFKKIFQEMGFEVNEKVSIKHLYNHPVMKTMTDSCKKYLKLNVLEVVSKEEVTSAVLL